MTRIMCTRPLHQALRQSGERRAQARHVKSPEPRLGNWAATSVLDLRPQLVVIVEERSSLTLLVRLKPTASLRRRLSDALRVALTVRGVPPDLADLEAAHVQSAAFTALRGRAELKGALEFAAFETACHVCERQDADSVQQMLEESPHANAFPLTPTQVIRRLFNVPAGSSPQP